MATLGGLSVNIQSLNTGISRRKIQHNIYGVDGAVVEDTGRNLSTYTIEVICVGSSWEGDREALKYALDESKTLILNHEDTGYIKVEVLSYSINESRLVKGLATFSIELLESLDKAVLITLDSKLSLFGKLKKAYAKYESIMKTIGKYKGIALSLVTQARGIINEVLNLPNTLIGSATGFLGGLIEQIDALDTDQLLQIQDMIFNPIKFADDGVTPIVIPEDELEVLLKVERIIKIVGFTKTIEKLTNKSQFETLESALEVHKKLNIHYNNIMLSIDPELEEGFVEAYAEYLDQWESSKPNLKSIHKFTSTGALLTDLFEVDSDIDFDEIFNTQTITLYDLFTSSPVGKEVYYLK